MLDLSDTCKDKYGHNLYRCYCDQCNCDRGYRAKNSPGPLCRTCAELNKRDNNRFFIDDVEHRKCPTCDTILPCQEGLWLLDKRKKHPACFSQCRECHSKRSKKWYSKNREEIISKSKEKYRDDIKNRDKRKSSALKYRKRNKEKCNLYYRRWASNNKRRPLAVLESRLRASFYYRLRWSIKPNKYTGCSLEELRRYIESLFQEGMSWENKEEWHIDHICPCSQAQTEGELISLQHYTNLRPMWAKENIKKSDSPTEDGIKMCRILLKREWIYGRRTNELG